MEALYGWTDEDRRVCLRWNVDLPTGAELPSAMAALDRADPSGLIDAEAEVGYADRVWSLLMAELPAGIAALSEPVMADLAYRLNTRQQRRGFTLQGKGHNPQFGADLLSRS